MNTCMISEMRHNSCFYIENTSCSRNNRSCKQDTCTMSCARNPIPFNTKCNKIYSQQH